MNYLLTVIALSAFYYILYKLVFARFSFFMANRVVLLTTPLLAIVTPLLASLLPFNTILALQPITIEATAVTLNASPTTTSGITWLHMARYFYCVIIGFAFFKFLFRLRAILSIIKAATKHTSLGFSYSISTQIDAPFSFFKTIVLPVKQYSEGEKQTILKHEAVHCVQWHSLDNLYFTMLSCIFWINPFFYLMAKEIRQVHECLADNQAIKNTSRAEYAQMLLSQTFGKEIVFPAHAFFNSSLIKTRITMMYKTKTSSTMKWSYLLLLPALVLTTIFSCSKQQEEAPVNFALVDNPPLFKSCNENATVDEQKICFQREIINTVASNFKYPESALALKMEGKVYFGFIINSKGVVSNIEVKRGLTGNTNAEKQAAEDVNKEAERVLKLLKDLEPATINSKAVAMSFTLPINLTLPVKKEVEIEEVPFSDSE